MGNAAAYPDGASRLFGPHGLTLNKLQDSTAMARGIAGHNALHRRTPNGVIITPLPQRTSRKTRQPFEIVPAANTEGGEPQVRIYTGTLAGDTPSGFSDGDDPPYLVTVADGDHIYAELTFDVSGSLPGDITSRDIGVGATVPDDAPDEGHFYTLIGTVAVTDGVVKATQMQYGPINATLYRLWFANPIVFAIAWM